MGKTWAQRFKVTCEIEAQLEVFDTLSSNVAIRILKTMLHNYLMNGTTYIGKELKLIVRGDRDRIILVNLYDDPTKRDVVLIRAVDEPEPEPKPESKLASADVCPELIEDFD